MKSKIVNGKYGMGKIKRLSQSEAQKIAAGQVIDRPANVVKELLENSIDAQATKISIAIENGGKDLIRVVDNGFGMNAEDAQLCFEKHATSKITSIDELVSITSYGFRGEALASIAAVSKVIMLTKELESTEGTKVTAESGSILLESTACPTGTDISISSLFYNIPAREKFLKKRETESRHITQMIQAISFAHPEIHITLSVDGKTLYNCPAQESIKDRFGQLWDHSTAQHMIEINGTHKGNMLSISGAISNHQWFRYDRSAIFFLVNNRWVNNFGLGRALLKGYNNVIPHGKYPMACISITINPPLIDVNMHPRKEEVKFANPRTVEQLIEQTVRAALETHLSKQIKRDVSFAHTSPPSASYSFKPASFASFEKNEIPLYKQMPHAMEIELNTIQSYSEKPFPLESSTTNIATESPQTISILEKKEGDHPYTIIGQYNKTYILLEHEDGLFLIDQHAAHERVLYELFENRFEQLPTINLMFPQLITCSKEDLIIIEPYLDLFKKHGITIDRFGEDQLIIQSTPVHLKNVPLQEIIKQAMSWIKEDDGIHKNEFTQSLNNKLRAQMACKAAVKAGDTLTTEQMNELLIDLHKAPNRFSCPHGRPTGWLLTLDEIEKKFRRKL